VASLKAARQCGAEGLQTAARPARGPRPDPASPRDEPASRFTGKGVVVASIDFGYDFAHANLRRRDGRTRFLALWDQRETAGRGEEAPFGYGREILRGQIDDALGTDDPYGALGYDPADADTDGTGSHATHVLDIAAGSGAAPGSRRGVAPGADLVAVHLRGGDTRRTDCLGDSVRLLEALAYVARRAGGRPLVVNVSLGSSGGPHDASTLVEQAIDIFVEAAPGRAVVLSAGNYYGAGLHVAGRQRSGAEDGLEWTLPARRSSEAELECWYDGRDVREVGVVGPDGTLLAAAPRGETRVVRDGNGAVLASLHHRRRDPGNADNHVDVFLSPRAPGGEWRVVLRSLQVTGSGRYDAWIERTVPEEQSRFAPGAASAEGTINTICTGRQSIAVGAFDAAAAECPPGGFSSAGPTRDGRLKPDVSAPGVGIVAARSSPRRGREPGLAHRLVEKSGTSMAAPEVAGTIALMFEAAAPARLGIGRTRDILTRSALRSPPSGTDALRYGHGRLHGAAAVALAAQASLERGVW
jgi:subtilisin family serine protease